MNISDSVHLTYCLNIHPGETWDEHLGAIRTQALAVRDRVGGGAPFGLGLRISALAARTLNEDLALRTAFKEFLRQENVYVFTINGFPYGRFHGERVKERVYQPDWRDPARLSYTLMLAATLAEWMEEGMTGSISTVPGGYRPHVRDLADRQAISDQLMDAVAGLATILRETGKEIHLGLEPEPACMLESTEDFITFWREIVMTHGRDRLAKGMGVNRLAAETLIRRHLGVCLDTCHAALQFEDPAECIDQYQTEGIKLSKIQISAALQMDNTEQARRALRAFDEPVYLHQTRARAAEGMIVAWNDLPEALAALPGHPSDETVRVHFHVPMFWGGTDVLGTTAVLLNRAFWDRLRAGVCAHLEIETYTYDVLPESLKSASIDESIAREWDWVSAHLN